MNDEEVIVIDDANENVQLIREIIKTKDQEDAFYLLDIGDVINKHRNWLLKMPRVQPHFAIKCNPDPIVIKTLAALNASFDCASKHEIQQVLSSGVSGDRIIFANTAKPPSHIKFAREVGVNLLTVDSEYELCKIRDIFPEAKIVIRFQCDALDVVLSLGCKFGCDSVNEAPKLIRKVKDLGMNLHGFSFHVGGQCQDITAWGRGIKVSLDLIDYAKSLGIQNVKLIDIGGGFPNNKGHLMDMIAAEINEVLNGIDPSINVISEPGRYYVASAYTLVSFIHSKRIVNDINSGTRYMYHINDGTFGSFSQFLLGRETQMPSLLNKPKSTETTYPSTIWGPTCDSIDCVVPDCNLPELNIGDWLVWRDMGAYSISMAGKFNGILPPTVVPFIRRKDRRSFIDERDAEKIAMLNKV